MKKTMSIEIGVMSAALVIMMMSSGCFWVTTKSEGDTLRQDMKKLDTRLEKREDDLGDKVQKLQGVLDEATGLLKRNSADLGADVQALSDDIRTMQGLVTAAKRYTDDVSAEILALKKQLDDERDVAQKRIVSLEQRLLEVEERLNKPVAQTAAELWDQGKAAYDAANYPEARKLLKRLVVQFPGHERGDDAQYYQGEAFFKEKDYDGAIREFQKVFDKYDSSPLADDALFRAGEAAEALLRCTEARAYYGLLRQKYPKSSMVKQAKSKDSELKKNARDRKKCIS